ncbi:MAG: hypothetical protein QW622_03685 [Candidatus Pacearchaeota archaeon]
MKEKAFTSITEIEKRYNKWITINIAMFVILVLAIGAIVYAGARSGLLTGMAVSHPVSQIEAAQCPDNQYVKGFSGTGLICGTPAGGGEQFWTVNSPSGIKYDGTSPVQIGPYTSGANGLILKMKDRNQQTGHVNSPMLIWDNTYTAFGIRSDDDKLMIGKYTYYPPSFTPRFVVKKDGGVVEEGLKYTYGYTCGTGYGNFCEWKNIGYDSPYIGAGRMCFAYPVGSVGYFCSGYELAGVECRYDPVSGNIQGRVIEYGADETGSCFVGCHYVCFS